MDTTLITSTAAVLALGGFAIAEVRARRWKSIASTNRHWANRLLDQHCEALDRFEDNARQRLIMAELDAGITRQRELRLKRSQAALKGHATRRQG